jgi:protein SCO1
MIVRISMLMLIAISLFLSAELNLCTATANMVSHQSKATEFVCPMHSEIKSSSAGSCPKCGMGLRRAGVQTEPTESEEPKIKGSDSALEIKIPDVRVIDQNGKSLNFLSDLIKGKTVAINFIFTTCTTICPPLTATMRQIQREMDTRIGRDIWLVSVSVDPLIDSPERLRSFASKFEAGRGWTFVTGHKTDIDRLLRALGAYVSDKNNHSPTILVGNEPSGYWTRVYGLAPASKIARLIGEAADRATQR